MQRPARRVLAEAAHSAPERSSCSEASTTIEADLDSIRPGQVATHRGHAGLTGSRASVLKIKPNSLRINYGTTHSCATGPM